MGVMAVLHDLNLALQYADDILFLKQGETIAYGPLNEVISEEVIRETYNYPVKIRYEEGRPFIVPVTPHSTPGFVTGSPAHAKNAKSVYSTQT
jgi:iron complex transport system ATP-binding protein